MMHQRFTWPNRARGWALAALTLVTGAVSMSCAEATSSRAGSIEIVGRVSSALEAPAVTALIVDATGPTGTQEIVLAGGGAMHGTWTSTNDLAAGAWTFHARAYTDCSDAASCVGHTVVYSTTANGGQDPTDTIASGETNTLSFVLQEENGADPATHDFANAAPRVRTLTVSPGTTIGPGATLTFAATVDDADEPGGFTGAYEWTEGTAGVAGSFSASTSATTDWTAPLAGGDGDHQLVLLATDAHGAAAEIVVIVTVAP